MAACCRCCCTASGALVVVCASRERVQSLPPSGAATSGGTLPQVVVAFRAAGAAAAAAPGCCRPTPLAHVLLACKAAGEAASEAAAPWRLPCLLPMQSCMTSNKCKAWSFRSKDGACRLFTNSPFNSKNAVAIQKNSDEDKVWQSGTGALPLMLLAGMQGGRPTHKGGEGGVPASEPPTAGGCLPMLADCIMPACDTRWLRCCCGHRMLFGVACCVTPCSSWARCAAVDKLKGGSDNGDSEDDDDGAEVQYKSTLDCMTYRWAAPRRSAGTHLIGAPSARAATWRAVGAALLPPQ